MPSKRISEELNEGIYFITFTVKGFHYLFDRFDRWNILSQSIKYCQENKDLSVYSYVFMLNHIHLVIESKDIIGFVRDFKKFTSKKIKQNIIDNESEILNLFADSKGIYSLWEKTNMPKQIGTEEFYLQKVNYIHNNPVKKNYVTRPEYWYWSSANPYSEISVKDTGTR